MVHFYLSWEKKLFGSSEKLVLFSMNEQNPGFMLHNVYFMCLVRETTHNCVFLTYLWKIFVLCHRDLVKETRFSIFSAGVFKWEMLRLS